MTFTRPSLPRGWRLVLTLSLALNLLFAGLGAGVLLRRAGDAPPPPQAQHRLGFGQFNAGLEREDYRALRDAFDARGLDFRAALAAEQADRQALLAALRATPFDAAAFTAAANSITARGVERMDLGNALIRDHVLAMTDERRRLFADRLEEAVRRSTPRPRPPRNASAD